MKCDLCGSLDLKPLYSPPDSRRDVTVFICSKCALVQSIARFEEAPDRDARPSGGADWGNIRYGKAFSTGAAIDALGQRTELTAIRSCLDVGSNRGSFVEALKALNPRVDITAIEPDESVIGDYAELEGVTLARSGIEEVSLDKEGYDLVYCCHTFEHLSRPGLVLSMIERALRPGGLLYIEVPGLDFVGRDDLVEEFFIDKHRFHFSLPVLKSYLLKAGFTLDDKSSSAPPERIVMVVEKAAGPRVLELSDPEEVMKGEAW